MTKSKPRVGDFIVTNKLFQARDENGDIYETENHEKFFGFIVNIKKDNVYGIKIGPDFYFTHNLNGLLSDNTGCYTDVNGIDILTP